MIADDLVDDDLRHERHRNAKCLQEKAGRQHLDEIGPVALDHLMEPGKIIFFLEVGPAPPRRKRKHLACPELGEPHGRYGQRLRQRRIDQEKDRILRQDQDGKMAAAQPHDGRHRQLLQLLERRAEQGSLQPVPARDRGQPLEVKLLVLRARQGSPVRKQAIVPEDFCHRPASGICYLFLHPKLLFPTSPNNIYHYSISPCSAPRKIRAYAKSSRKTLSLELFASFCPARRPRQEITSTLRASQTKR
jgi:hypothetical protein